MAIKVHAVVEGVTGFGADFEIKTDADTYESMTLACEAISEWAAKEFAPLGDATKIRKITLHFEQ